MAQRVDGPWLKVGKLIELFVAMGCELHNLPGDIMGPDGTYKVRFLLNPITRTFVSLSDLDNDEMLPPSEIAYWERRLKMSIPKGGTNVN
jgi:hypothetical protein